jgi:VWFA-related protein
VFAVVRDRQARDIGGLTASDFDVRDPGGTVAVNNFAHVKVEAASSSVSAGSVSTGAQDGARLFTILYDDLHSAPHRAVAARRVAERLITRWVRPADLVAVRRVSDEGTFALSPAGSREAALQQAQRLAGGVTGEPLHDRERVSRIERLMRVLAAVADATGHSPERRAVIVLISEGMTYDVFSTRLGSADVVRVTEEAIATLRRTNVVLYAIDPRGLASAEGAAIETGAGDAGGFSISEASKGLSSARSNLRHLAEETGGFAAINGNNLDRAADRVGEELSSYYLLGFTPLPQQCDGSFKRIRVRVHRPHLRVTARAGYVCGIAPAR